MNKLKKVNIFPGRFQPFHNGHLQDCKDAFDENGLPVYIMYIHNEKFDSRKPFDDELTKKELERLVDKYEFIEGINWIRRPMPITICRVCIENGYEPVLWLAGDDRVDGYKKLMKGKSIKDELGIDEPEFYITKRYASGTDVREAIKNDDEKTFKEMMPKEAHDLYGEFKKQLSSIKESKIYKYINNTDMKNLNKYIADKNDEHIDESFLSIGLTIIVALILAKFTFKGIGAIAQIFKGVKEAVGSAKEYNEAIKQLDTLLQPYKDDLMKTEWGSKLFTADGIINNSSVKEKGCSIIYWNLDEDIKSVLSDEDYKEYKNIIKPIYDIEHAQLATKLKI